MDLHQEESNISISSLKLKLQLLLTGALKIVVEKAQAKSTLRPKNTFV
jgi:hypothetical protein